MRYILDKTTDPYFNLAVEEYLLKNSKEPVFRLWRNAPSVIVGRYQNALAEINRDFIEKNQIPVVRRLSGGGAVFHDLGNINYTFIDTRREGEDTSAMFRRFSAPVISALRAMGVPAVLEGRNDLLIEGRKFSGNAIAVHGDRVLQHGTLLFKSSIGNLAAALNTRPEKFTGKAVKSNVARVTNISEHLPQDRKDMTVEDMMEWLFGFIAAGENQKSEYSRKELDAIGALKESRYATMEWNYGKSPRYSFRNSAKFRCGFIEVCLDVKDGVISGCSIMGDYFFTRPTEELCRALEGVPHSRRAVGERLSSLPVADYFGEDITDELLSLI